MKSILTLFFLAFFTISCNKENEKLSTQCFNINDSEQKYGWLNGPISSTDTCKTYQDIWKTLFLEKNGISEEYFKTHISPKSSFINIGNDVLSFNICYTVTNDWATTYNCDQFIIKITIGNLLYPALKVSRGSLLSKEEIRDVLNKRAFSSSINKLSPIKNLEFQSQQEALNELIKFSNVNKLCFGDLIIDKDSGEPILEAFGQYVNKDNSCISAKINLVTGEKTYINNPCAIN